MVCPVCILPFVTGAMAIKGADAAASSVTENYEQTPWYKTEYFLISVTAILVFITIYFFWNKKKLKKQCKACTVSP
jgi:ABC-type glucose/galactose transport system permease subunit